jgi:biotin operon repressor
MEEMNDTLPAIRDTRQKNIPIEKIISLRKRNLSYSEIARILGCAKSNVIQRLEASGIDIDTVEDYKSNRADLYAAMCAAAMNHMTTAKLEKANIKDLAIFTGIMSDHERKWRGLSTQIIDYSGASQELANLQKQLDDYEARERATVDITQVVESKEESDT